MFTILYLPVCVYSSLWQLVWSMCVSIGVSGVCHVCGSTSCGP